MLVSCGDLGSGHPDPARRPGGDQAGVQLEHLGGGPDRLHAREAGTRAAVEDPAPVPFDDAHHHAGALAGQAEGGVHVDLAMPHDEGLAATGRLQEGADQAAVADVLGLRLLRARPVHAVHAGDARHRAVVGRLLHHRLAHHLEQAVQVDRIGRRRLVRAALGAVEHPVGRDQDHLGADLVGGLGQMARRVDVGAPRQGAIVIHEIEPLEDRRVDDRVGPERAHAFQDLVAVGHVDAAVLVGDRALRLPAVHGREHLCAVLFGGDLDDVAADESGASGHVYLHRVPTSLSDIGILCRRQSRVSRQSTHPPPAAEEASAASTKASPRAPSATVGKCSASGSGTPPERRAAITSAASA